MTEETAQTNTTPAQDAPQTTPKEQKAPTSATPRGGRKPRDMKKNMRSRRGKKPARDKRSEFDQKIVAIRRVTRVVAGGRRFSFSVAMVIGDKRGSVGVGTGKAGDTALAIEKSVQNAKKQMIKLPLTEEMTIPHEVSAKYASSEVWISPAPGKGIVAGSSVRTVLELAGVRDVTAKLLTRSKNRLNNAQAALEALKKLKK